MTFNPNIPVGTDKILKSSRQIKANFQAINQAFFDNHVALTEDQSIAGEHNYLTMREQTLDPATNSDQIALYTKAVSSVSELFYRPNNSQTPIQLTYPSINTDSTTTNQYSFIAGPFVVYFGLLNTVTQGQLVTMLPSSTLIYVNLQMTNLTIKIFDEFPPIGPKVAFVPYPSNILANTFQIGFDSLILAKSFDVYYFVIGLG